MPIRADGIDTVFFERQLNVVQTRTYDRKYPELIGRTLVKTNRTMSPGDKSFTWYEYDQYGMIQLISSDTTTLPRADVDAKENTGRVYYYGNAYGWTYLEILAAQRAKTPLVDKKAAAARRKWEEKVDELIAVGDSDLGLVGLLNQPNALGYTVPNGVSTHADWARKMPDEILKDLNGMRAKVYTTSKGVFQVNTILLPLDQHTHISTTARSESSDVTILEFFLKNNPGVSVKPWFRCTGAGVGNTDRMVGYNDSDEFLEFYVSMEFEQLPVQEKGIGFEVNCMGGAGGVVAYYPTTLIYGDGI